MRHSLTPFRALLTCTYLVCAAAAHGASQADWPSIAMPPSASSHRLGDDVSMVGMPLRMTVFTSPERPAALVEWFGASIGRPLVLDTVAGKTVLGRREGAFYITLQLEAAGSGTRGWVAVSDIAGFLQKRTQNREAEVRWEERLPADTQIMSRMHSRDGTRQSDYLVAKNRHSEQVNVQALSALLSAHGLVLQRDVSPGTNVRSPSILESTATQPKARPQSPALPFAVNSGRTLFYRGRDKEAMAVIARDERGSTSLVVSLVTPIEPTR
ncbi:MAG: hypothetical protein JWR22_4225 [Herminiimonas sp.]|nr:hypothetical protein [Herminiimonas sp.]